MLVKSQFKKYLNLILLIRAFIIILIRYKMQEEKAQKHNENQLADEFIVKVKLLTNEVYQFTIDPQNTKVSELKQKIQERINVPIQRQRIVYGGKQLVDENKVTQYVKQSGMAVHLIAKANNVQTQTPPQPNIQNSSQTNNQQNNNQTNQNSNLPPNPFGNIMSMFSNGLGGAQTATINLPNINSMGDFNNQIGGILGSLGIRLPGVQNSNHQNNPFQTPPTNGNRRAQNQQIPVTASFTTNPINTGSFTTNPTNAARDVLGPSVSSNVIIPSTQTFSVSNEPILNLNQTISTLNLPSQPVLENTHLSLREQTSQYLRRLQHQYMRLIPQLNRSVQLLNEGRTSHLSEVRRLFTSMTQANNHAIEAIDRVINLPVNQQPSNQANNQANYQVQQQNGQQQTGQQSNQMEVEPPLNVEATIIIQAEDILDDDIDEEPTNFNTHHNQQNQQNQQLPTQQNPIINTNGTTTTINLGNLGPNGFGGLSNLLGSLGQISNNQGGQGQMAGFNIGNIMSMFGGNNINTQQNHQSQNIAQQNITQQSQQPQQSQQSQNVTQQNVPLQNQQPQQSPIQGIDLNSLGNIASMLFNPPVQNTATSSQPQGMNLMNIFSSLQSSGSMGQLMSMSLGDMLQEGTDEQTIYSNILRSFVGSDLIGCFTTKNFDFLDRNYIKIRQDFLKAISLAGSQSILIEQLTQDIKELITPKLHIKDRSICCKQVYARVHKSISQLTQITLNRGDAKYSQKVLSSLKGAFCESISIIIKFVIKQELSNQTPEQFFFSNLKTTSIQLMNQFIEGLSGMFYGFIQKDFIRIYNEYKEEQKRKKQRSSQQIASQEDLLKQIEQQSKKDIQYLTNFKYSPHYLPQNKQ